MLPSVHSVAVLALVVQIRTAPGTYVRCTARPGSSSGEASFEHRPERIAANPAAMLVGWNQSGAYSVNIVVLGYCRVPHRARGGRLDRQAALPAGHGRPDHALPDARRGGRGAGLHATAVRCGGAPAPNRPASVRGARPDALPRRRRPSLRLRARPPRGQAHAVRRTLRCPGLELALSACCPLEIIAGGAARARFELGVGDAATFVLDRVGPASCRCPTPMPT